MLGKNFEVLDANEAAADVAYRLSEVIAIYPITPSSPMAEHCDEWASKDRKNLFGVVPTIEEMQSEGGAAGAVHGALIGGTLATTFTASQGLLLMIPNMYKIAGELLPFVMHVAARSLATHALSIFGDHSDVMACRQTGFAMLASNSVQEAHDLACIAHAATLKSRVPFVHFFDGFRTSHEINTLAKIDDDTLHAMIDERTILEHRLRGLTPDNPFIRGTSQNPDVFFQCRERANVFHEKVASIVGDCMEQFKDLTGRKYELFEYAGAADAERVIVAMGSACETIGEVVKHLNNCGEKVGLLKVRLYRPFSVDGFAKALPKSTKAIAVLDRTKEPGSIGEPLFLDVVASIEQSIGLGGIKIIGGRYGIGSKEFSPAMAKAVFDELAKSEAKKHFTIGIGDDVSNLSLEYDGNFEIRHGGLFEAVFFGLGSDGTVGANKNTIKIIGSDTDNYVQAYFVYDSKKSGAMTVSHLRFGKELIRAPYLIERADFVACHQFSFLKKFDILKYAKHGAVFLLNSVFDANSVWEQLPLEAQEAIVKKNINFYAIDAYDVARKCGMGGRINTIMQTCFFAISGVLPQDEAIAKIKNSIQKTYGQKGQHVVDQNFAAVDSTLAHLAKISVKGDLNASPRVATIDRTAPEFVRNVIAKMLLNEGDTLPVSLFPVDGTWPSATTQYEKRNIAQEIPVWTPEVCIQCNKCVSTCPHAAIRSKYYNPNALAEVDGEHLKSIDFRSKSISGAKFTVQVSPEDCTGCGLCTEICPGKSKQNPDAKALNLVQIGEVFEGEKRSSEIFNGIPYPDVCDLGNDLKSVQFRQPLFEFSGACSGCGEAPYVKMLMQLFGDRAIVANATGCSSIYGGNLPTTPYCKNSDGRGPAWANSLFEDNAEFGLGLRLSIDKRREIATLLLRKLAPTIGDDLVDAILSAQCSSDSEIKFQRERVEALKNKLANAGGKDAEILHNLADFFVDKSLWIVGGDGWAYDIGYGGLDHILASGHNVNVLVLDTEVYSNTGGQQSKATPIGAIAKFASRGKSQPKKDLAMLAISYGNIYVAKVALGAKDSHVVRAFYEAESYGGPSLILAYSPCVAHGYDLRKGPDQQRKAVDSGYWPLYRFDPRKKSTDAPPFTLDSDDPKIDLADYMSGETRFKALMDKDPGRAKALLSAEEAYVKERFAMYKSFASGTRGTIGKAEE
ncbi:MAG: pyruvate:ferredoxin (flavodoxin) oxidoreductase [Puniceicoccales bacterium]|jgi:pyruvate-ferredoxin/flavodoxin oxidoreductase|nr:pyruvate:ferredoxin (flavodoxin) oxidoreductase [Puniceicoccales bacterium]